MSDREIIAAALAEVLANDAHADYPEPWAGCQWCDLRAILSRTAPVEPPVLSRAALDEMIERKVWHKGPAIEMHMKIGANLLRDAILESLSQESGR